MALIPELDCHFAFVTRHRCGKRTTLVLDLHLLSRRVEGPEIHPASAGAHAAELAYVRVKAVEAHGYELPIPLMRLDGEVVRGQVNNILGGSRYRHHREGRICRSCERNEGQQISLHWTEPSFWISLPIPYPDNIKL